MVNFLLTFDWFGKTYPKAVLGKDHKGLLREKHEQEEIEIQSEDSTDRKKRENDRFLKKEKVKRDD